MKYAAAFEASAATKEELLSENIQSVETTPDDTTRRSMENEYTKETTLIRERIQGLKKKYPAEKRNQKRKLVMEIFNFDVA